MGVTAGATTRVRSRSTRPMMRKLVAIVSAETNTTDAHTIRLRTSRSVIVGLPFMGIVIVVVVVMTSFLGSGLVHVDGFGGRLDRL